MSTKVLHGVWRPGTGGQHWRTGMTFRELEREDESARGKGLRMHDLVHATGDGYTAVWRKGSGKCHWVAGVRKVQEIIALNAELVREEGVRLHAATRRSTYCAIWRPGTGKTDIRSGMAIALFKHEDAEHFKAGMHLQAVEGYLKDGHKRFFAVWRTGKGAQYWQTGSAIPGADQAYFNLGFRIATRTHGNGEQVFVWRRGTGAQVWTHRAVSAFKTFDRKMLDKGLRLVTLTVGFSL